MSGSESRQLICTVGGSHEAVVASLKYWKPCQVIFVISPKIESERVVETKIVPSARNQGIDITPGQWKSCKVSDENDLSSCLESIRDLTQDVEDWIKRGKDFLVVVDFTGGTKCMSAAMVLQAHRWPCSFSYVSGNERTKGGVGQVVTGTEKVVQRVNPWDALGYEAVEDFVALFDKYAFSAAAMRAEETLKKMTDVSRKKELATLVKLANAFAKWERFDHKNSLRYFEDVMKSSNDLRAVLGKKKGDCILRDIESFFSHLDGLVSCPSPSRFHVIDLIANAERRFEEKRIDDAVARLYRAIEAISQIALKERHGITETDKISLDKLPATLQEEWGPRVSDENEMFSIGLQDSYKLLIHLGDPLGKKFEALGLIGQESLLAARNHSILAHGFKLIKPEICCKLWKNTLQLAELENSVIPKFPKLKS